MLTLGDDGVVVMPLERAEAVAREAVDNAGKESQRIAAIGRGLVSPAWLDDTIRRMGIVKN